MEEEQNDILNGINNLKKETEKKYEQSTVDAKEAEKALEKRGLRLGLTTLAQPQPNGPAEQLSRVVSTVPVSLAQPAERPSEVPVLPVPAIQPVDQSLVTTSESVVEVVKGDPVLEIDSNPRKAATLEKDQPIRVTVTDLVESVSETRPAQMYSINLNSEEVYDSFKYEVLMNGIVIYCKDEYKYDLYKITTIREYLELNESRQDIIKRIKEGGTIYGK